MKSEKTIPSARGSLPVLGHARTLARNPLSFLASLPAEAGLVRVRLGPNPIVVVCDQALTDQVLRDDRTYDKGGPLIDLVAPAVGDGLATCPRSEHRAPRRLLQPMFHPDRLRDYADGMVSAITTVVDGWQEGGILDVPCEMRKLALRVAVRSFFSDQMSPAVRDQTADDLTAVLVGFAQRMSRPPFFNLFPTATNRRYKAALGRIRRLAADTIAIRRADAAGADDVLGALVNGRDAEGEPVLGESNRIDHLLTFLVAPTATVGSVLSWALHELAMSPVLQDRLQQEVRTVLGGAPATFEHLSELEFTKRFVTETLRMYPSLWFAPLRVVTADAWLGGYELPRGTVIAFSPYLVHRNGKSYDNPDRFDPDRWEGAVLPAASRQAFIPFGTGSRQCIAQDFAFNELVLALATIAGQWRLEPVAGSPLSTRASVNLTPRGLQVRAFRLEGTKDEKCNVGIRESSAEMARMRPGGRRPTGRLAWQI